MTDRIQRFAPWTALILFPVVLCVVLLGEGSYVFQYREQQQLFLYDTDYFSSYLGRIGGLGLYLSQYLVQFFTSPSAGIAVSVLILTASAALLYAALSTLTSDRVLPLLGLVPAFLQGIYLRDVDVNYCQLIAFLALCILIYGYSLIGSRLNWIVRSILGTLVTGLFYMGFGSMALALACWMLVWDVSKRNPRPLTGLFSFLTVLFIGFYAVHSSMVTDYEETFSVRLYLAPDATMRYYHAFSFALLSAAPLVVRFMDRHWKARQGLRSAVCVILSLGFLLMVERMESAERDADVCHLNLLMTQARSSEWGKILQDDDLDRNQFFIMIRNLALANEGRLLEDLFKYPQPAASRGLIMDHQYVEELDEVFSMVYEYCSLPAASLYYGQDVYSAIPFGNPTLLQRIIRMKLALGDYQVALKYLSFLERTHSYRTWAESMRALVGDDAACLENEYIGRLRRGLGEEDGDGQFLLVNGAYYDLVEVLSNNPSDRQARDYAVALLLLECDTRDLLDFVERFQGTPVLEDCPTLMQEAILTLSENDQELCRSRGVTDAVMKRYQNFRNLALQARQGNTVVAAAINREYGSTYWYYLMKKLGMLK